MSVNVDPKLQEELLDAAVEYQHDPLGFVEYAWPWGEPGTELEHESLENWQIEVLDTIGHDLREGRAPIRWTAATGHGVGKSALNAMLGIWSVATFPETLGVFTANTDTQLRSKTWVAMAKWHRLCAYRHWFHCTATALHSVQRNYERSWRLDALPWSETNPEAFQGLHNKGKRLIITFDEASAIHEDIWEAIEGALTDSNTEIIFGATGNPTRTTGKFRDIHLGPLKKRWHRWQVDSRTVNLSNKVLIDQWVQDYGEDSDFCRVRVLGRFPRASVTQLIPTDLVQEAMTREARHNIPDPLIMGVDVARGGDDNSVIRWRKGLDATVEKAVKIMGVDCRDSMLFSSRIAAEIERTDPDHIFVDATGIGGPVADRLRQLGFRNVVDVQFGGAATNAAKYANKRTEIWYKLLEWLQAGGTLPNDSQLETDLTGPEYTHDKKDRLILTPKERMTEELGLASPDDGDALACTFAQPVAQKDHGKHHPPARKSSTRRREYNPLGRLPNRRR